ncbi:MAG: histidinol-phosphatase [Candidatus Marinimicrobia bacterium]|nr:histidinol-phosphatase [Candidatus Neomarinimicrobiota bacterium]
MKKLYEYTGCIHGHSIYSDGSGTYPEIIGFAQEVRLDYLLMSDHMTLKGKEEGYGGWHDSLFVHIGYEIQDPEDQHHYLAFGIDEVLPKELTHQEYIREVEKRNALGIAAHPFEERDIKTSLPGFPPISWTTLDYSEIKVIEIWNMMSHWMEETTLKNRYWNAARPRSFAKSPKKNLMQWWDSANLSRKVTGVGSVDVHAIKVKILGIFSKAIFHYKVMFKSIRTYLLTEEPLSKENTDKQNEQIILNTIRHGRSYIANIKRGDASGFRFWMEHNDQNFQMGDEFFGDRAMLHVQLPLQGFIKIICNGKVCHIEKKSKGISIEVSPGIYRIEVKRKRRGWIYSNHIKMRDKNEQCVE